jgi:hypothetical protein
MWIIISRLDDPSEELLVPEVVGVVESVPDDAGLPIVLREVDE